MASLAPASSHSPSAGSSSSGGGKGSAMDDTSDTVTKISKKNLHPVDEETQTDFTQSYKNSLKYVRKHLPFPLADGTVPTTTSTTTTATGVKRRKKPSGVGPAVVCEQNAITVGQQTVLLENGELNHAALDPVCDSTTPNGVVVAKETTTTMTTTPEVAASLFNPNTNDEELGAGGGDDDEDDVDVDPTGEAEVSSTTLDSAANAERNEPPATASAAASLRKPSVAADDTVEKVKRADLDEDNGKISATKAELESPAKVAEGGRNESITQLMTTTTATAAFEEGASDRKEFVHSISKKFVKEPPDLVWIGKDHLPNGATATYEEKHETDGAEDDSVVYDRWTPSTLGLDFPSVTAEPRKWSEIPDVVQVKLDEDEPGKKRDDDDAREVVAEEAREVDGGIKYSEFEEHNRRNKLLQRRLSHPRCTPVRAANNAGPLSSPPGSDDGMKKNPPRGAKTHHKLVQNATDERRSESPPYRPVKVERELVVGDRRRYSVEDGEERRIRGGMAFGRVGDLFWCPVCGERVKDLKDHVRGSHDPAKHFVCGICGQEFSYRSSVSRHSRRVHSAFQTQAVERPFSLRAFLDGYARVSKIDNGANTARKMTAALRAKSLKAKALKVTRQNVTTVEKAASRCAPLGFSAAAAAASSSSESISGSSQRFIDGFPFDILPGQKRELVCPICSKALISSEKLRFHIRGLHHPKKHLVCKVNGCGRKFDWRSTIISHQINDHGHNFGSDMIEVLPLHLGKYLRKVLAGQTAGWANVSRMGESKDDVVSPAIKKEIDPLLPKSDPSPTIEHHPCPLCRFSADRDASLRDHVMAVHSKENHFVCTVKNCNQSFKWRTAVVSHQKRQHSNEKNVGTMNQVRVIPLDLESFMRERRAEEEAAGPTTDQDLIEKDTNRNSKKPGCTTKMINGILYSFNKDGHIKCPLCDKALLAGRLKRHVMAIHTQRKHFCCRIKPCRVEFSALESLRKHQKKYHHIRSSVAPLTYTKIPFNLTAFLKSKLKEKEGINVRVAEKKSPEDMMKSILKKNLSVAAIRLINIKEEFFLDDFEDDDVVSPLRSPPSICKREVGETGEMSSSDPNGKSGRSDLYPLTNGSKAEELFVCELCSKSFGSRHQFDEHVRRTHDPPSSELVSNFSCDACAMTFSSEAEVVDHRLHCVVIRTCEFCSHVLPTEVGAKRHRAYCRKKSLLGRDDGTTGDRGRSDSGISESKDTPKMLHVSNIKLTNEISAQPTSAELAETESFILNMTGRNSYEGPKFRHPLSETRSEDKACLPDDSDSEYETIAGTAEGSAGAVASEKDGESIDKDLPAAEPESADKSSLNSSIGNDVDDGSPSSNIANNVAAETHDDVDNSPPSSNIANVIAETHDNVDDSSPSSNLANNVAAKTYDDVDNNPPSSNIANAIPETHDDDNVDDGSPSSNIANNVAAETHNDNDDAACEESPMILDDSSDESAEEECASLGKENADVSATISDISTKSSGKESLSPERNEKEVEASEPMADVAEVSRANVDTFVNNEKPDDFLDAEGPDEVEDCFHDAVEELPTDERDQQAESLRSDPDRVTKDDEKAPRPQTGKTRNYRIMPRGQKPFPCSYCQSGFTDPRNLKYHVRYKHRGKTFDLSHIDPAVVEREMKNFGNMKEARNWIRKNEVVMSKNGKGVTCTPAEGNGSKGSIRKDIGGFLVQVGTDGKLRCPICLESYRGYISLKRHVLSAHHSLHKLFRCQIAKCKGKFSDAKSALEHLEKTHNSRDMKKHIRELPFHLGNYKKHFGKSTASPKSSAAVPFTSAPDPLSATPAILEPSRSSPEVVVKGSSQTPKATPTRRATPTRDRVPPMRLQSLCDAAAVKGRMEPMEIDSHVPLKDLLMPGESPRIDPRERAAEAPTSLPFLEQFRDYFLMNRDASDGELRDTFMESLMIDTLLED